MRPCRQGRGNSTRFAVLSFPAHVSAHSRRFGINDSDTPISFLIGHPLGVLRNHEDHQGRHYFRCWATHRALTAPRSFGAARTRRHTAAAMATNTVTDSVQAALQSPICPLLENRLSLPEFKGSAKPGPRNFEAAHVRMNVTCTPHSDRADVFGTVVPTVSVSAQTAGRGARPLSPGQEASRPSSCASPDLCAPSR